MCKVEILSFFWVTLYVFKYYNGPLKKKAQKGNECAVASITAAVDCWYVWYWLETKRKACPKRVPLRPIPARDRNSPPNSSSYFFLHL